MALTHDSNPHHDWRKAKRSMSNGDCVEVVTGTGEVAVRDTKDPKGPVQKYTVPCWRCFLKAARNGQFDASQS